MLAVLLVATAIAGPAILLRAFCVGRSCERGAVANTAVPYCSLPDPVRRLVTAGFRDGRSPHVMAVTGATPVRNGAAVSDPAVTWPSVEQRQPDFVPLVFYGEAVAGGGTVPPGTELDDVAPTVARLIGLDRPHPEVRSGEAIEGLAEGGEGPRLVLEVVWKGVGTEDLKARRQAWPNLLSLLRDGAGTLDAQVGSLPLDPAAVLTTIGSGGLPQDHGITGTLVRNDEGRVVSAWGKGAPFSVIAALGDDLDELLRQEPRIGLVGTDPSDRGIIGGNWYVEGDKDDLALAPRPKRAVAEAVSLLRSGYGGDATPDLLAVVLGGPVAGMDGALGELVKVAEDVSDGSAAVVVTSSGSGGSRAGSLSAEEVEQEVERRAGPVIEATALGGLFVDQEALAATGISEDRIVTALRDLRDPLGRPLMGDVFPSIAVTFARYC
jgi:hypothetical protein